MPPKVDYPLLLGLLGSRDRVAELEQQYRQQAKKIINSMLTTRQDLSKAEQQDRLIRNTKQD